jgi:DNA-binding XRE family transcriptional regulator
VAKSRETPGQKLWLSLIEADQYDQGAETIVLPSGSDRMSPERATQNWSRGMARNLRARFPERLRRARDAAGLTQKQLSEMADLSATGLAMIERGERVPNLDTAARICWALDIASGDF